MARFSCNSGDALSALNTPTDCHPDSLRAQGWRQGCQLALELPHDYIHLVEGKHKPRKSTHGQWLISDQDCDLAWNARPGSSHIVELRPVYFEGPPDDWGIRNAKFLLDKSGAHLRSSSPSVRVAPEVFSVAEHLTCPHLKSVRRLKIWLGLRYDRPAVPQAYVETADAIARQIRAKKNRPAGAEVRDVLATFRHADDGKTQYTLIAVLPSELASQEMVEKTRLWLSDIALNVSEEFGMATDVDARPDTAISLAFVENSYSLDVSAVSWPANTPGPTGKV